MPRETRHGAAGRIAVLAVLAAATALAVLLPPAPGPDRPAPEITGEIQHFMLKQNPAAVAEAAFLDGDGRRLSLRDFAGKAVLVNFWATWCAPCVHEMPSLDRLAARLRGPGFALVALNEDRDGAAVARPFMEKLGLANLALYIDPGGAAQRALGVRTLPTTILIDARGREIGRLEGPADWSAPEAVKLVEFVMGAGADAAPTAPPP